MRARSAFFAGAGSVAILAVGWQAGLEQLTLALPTVDSTTSSSANGSTGASSPESSATVAPTPAGPKVPNGTYDGAIIETRYGTVQVQAVISNDSLVDVIALKLTDAERRSIVISEQVAPLLRDEVLAAQSANVANITGGTYTAQAYLQSLQSALDAAGFPG